MSKSDPRSRARRLAMQAVYQWLLSGDDIDTIAEQYQQDPQSQAADRTLMNALLRGVPTAHSELTAALQPHLDRPFAEVDPVEQAILLIACYELSHTPAIPFRVVINEAVRLAKTYGAEKGYQYVNGVLDKLAAGLPKAQQED